MSEILKKYLVAEINESTCIGCTKCIDACPFDAILGANQQLHAVVKDFCVGCQLCLPPCPVNCISLVDFPMTASQRLEQARQAKNRYQARVRRLKAQDLEKAQKDFKATQIDFDNAIAAAIERAKQKQNAFTNQAMLAEHE